VELKLADPVYKAINNLAPPDLSDDCQLVATTGHRQLQSSSDILVLAKDLVLVSLKKF